MSARRTFFVLAALMGTTAGSAASQEGVVDTLSRAAICDQAIRALRGRPTGEAYAGAVSELPACSSAGASALRVQWSQLPTDSADVRMLADVTPRLRDRSVFKDVLSVYRDPSRPRNARLAALQALMGYYQPGLIVVYVEPKVPVQHGSAYVRVGGGDPITSNGPTPLSANTRGEILTALDQVAKQDSDERLRLISAYIRTRLAALP